MGRGERLLLYSDGVTERRRTDGTLLGLEGLLSLLRTGPATSAAETVRVLHDAVIDASPQPLRDDATVLLLAPRGREARNQDDDGAEAASNPDGPYRP